MASVRKEDRRTGELQDRQNAEQARAIDRTIEETKDSAKKVIQEVKRELPEATAMFHDFQEQNINSIRDMTNSYLESQKQVAKSLQSAFQPFSNNTFMNMVYWPFYAMHPQTWSETYVRAASNAADTAIAVARASNDLMLAAMESTRSNIGHAQRNTEQLSKLAVENARTVEQLSRDFTSATASISQAA